MKLMGVELCLVISGLWMFCDVINEVMCDWMLSVEEIYYIFGLVVGLYLFLKIVCDF